MEMKAASLIQRCGSRTKTELQKLVSPIDGRRSTSGSAHGGRSGDTCSAAADGGTLRDHPVGVEAQLENRDIGFVKEGQPVGAQGRNVSIHSVWDDSRKVLTRLGRCGTVRQREGRSGLCDARVSMDRATMLVEGNKFISLPAWSRWNQTDSGGDRIFAEPY